MKLDLVKLAAILHPQELEMLAEIADGFDDDDIDSEGEDNDPSPDHDDYLRSILGAPSSDGPETRGPRKKSKKPKLKEYQAEYFDELAEEVKDTLKHMRRLPAVLSHKEIFQLLEAAKVDHRDYMIIRLLYATGCRRSEVVKMRLADLHLDERKLFVRHGKYDVDRYVFVDEETAKLLDDFVYGRALDDPIFDIGAEQINRVVKEWGEKTGLLQRYAAQGRRFSAHALRHTMATHLHESGADHFVLRDLLGHKYLSSTRIYIHLSAGRRIADYDKHHPLRSFELD